GVSPQSVPLAGGTNVSVTGFGFSPTELLSCVFNLSVETAHGHRHKDTVIVTAHWFSFNLVVCSAPEALPAATYFMSEQHQKITAMLAVSNNGVDIMGPWVHLQYLNAPSIEVIMPPGGPATGGTNVYVSGHDFVNNTALSCRFGNTTVSAIYHDLYNVSCLVPSFIASEGTGENGGITSVILSVSNNGDDFGNHVPFYYYPTAEITGISPRTVTIEDVLSGNAVVSVSGRGFIKILSPASQLMSKITCRFSDFGDSIATFVRPTLVECPVPIQVMTGQVMVTVSNNGIDFSKDEGGASITVAATPHVFSLSPTSGPDQGGTLLLVQGSKIGQLFSPQCTFTFASGNELSTPTVSRGRDVISCSTPSLLSSIDTPNDGTYSNQLTPVLVNVKVDGRQGSQGTAENDGAVQGLTSNLMFMYYPSHEVKSVWPSSGSAFTPVTIFGRGFIDSPDLLCRFGDKVVAPVSVTGFDTVICKAPPQKGDRVFAVEVTNNNADWSYNGYTFTYRPVLSLSAMNPRVGPLNGSTIVKVSGSGFMNDSSLSCRFGSRLVTAVPESTNEIHCVTPPAMNYGVVAVEVVENGNSFTSSGWSFNYLPDVEVTSEGPLAGPEYGGTIVTLIGLGFLGQTYIICEFGSHRSRVPGRWLGGTAFECKSPPHKPGLVILRLSINGQQFFDTHLVYEYRSRATIRTIDPEQGPDYGGTVIEVTGTGFVNASSLVCRFGDILSEVEFLDSTKVHCHVPRAPEGSMPKSVAVELSNNGADFTSSGIKYKYFSSLQAMDIEPNSGPTTGHTIVVISGMNFSELRSGRCLFNGTAVDASINGSRELLCLSPPMAEPGAVKVEITSRGHVIGSEFTFLYHDPMEIFSIFPRTVPEYGVSSILVIGSGFVKSKHLVCIFSPSDGKDLSGPAKFISRSLIKCDLPKLALGNIVVGVSSNGMDVSLAKEHLKVMAASTVSSLWPSSGSTAGGTMVQVQGTGFADSSEVYCRFGDKSVVPHMVLSSTVVVCRAPPHGEGGQVSVEVTTSKFDWTSSGVMFTYKPPIEVTDVYPTAGPLRGGTVVSIKILGFDSGSVDELSCRFGTNVVSIALIDSEGAALCISPEMSQAVTVPLELTNNGVDYTRSGWRFTYVPQINVENANPLSGSEYGGTEVVIVGSGFPHLNSLVCEFGSLGRPVRAHWLDQTKISCITPPQMPGTAALRIGPNRQQVLDSGLVFTYQATPTVLTMDPSFGPVLGGTHVNVIGAGFANSTEIACHFGDQTVAAIFIDNMNIWCVAPATRSVGKVSIQVSNYGKHFVSNSLQYRYVPALKVLHTHPSSGPTTGGTTLAILGSGFVGGGKLRCIIGGNVSTGVVLSDTELLCSTPEQNSMGPVLVEVTANGVDRVASQTKFTYIEPVLVDDVHPVSSSEFGGDRVVVSGRNFLPSDSLVCRFGARDIAKASWISTTSLSCLVPPSTSGPRIVTLSVSNNAQDFPAAYVTFTYKPGFTLYGVDPLAGPPQGGTEVVVTGTGLDKDGSWACVFGDLAAVIAERLPDGRLKCLTPSLPPGIVALRAFRSTSSMASAMAGALAAAADGSLQDFNLTFEYQGVVSTTSVEPLSGSIDGGTPITVRGSGFANTSSLSCGFLCLNGVMIKSPASFSSTNSAICMSPRLDHGVVCGHGGGTFFVSVILSLNSVDYSTHGPQFLYFKPVVVLGVSPELGSERGGTLVTVIGHNFIPSEELSCRFGAQLPVPAVFVNSETIQCVAPFSKLGPVSVSLTASNNLVEFSSTSALFEYHRAALPESFNPWAGPILGGTHVTVKGRDFHPSKRLACRFGTINIHATWESPTHILCKSPASAFAGPVRVQVTQNGVDWLDIGLNHNEPNHIKRDFLYYHPPMVESLLPRTGPLQGGTHVSILGRNLGAFFTYGQISDSVLCRFGKVVSPAISVVKSHTTNPVEMEEVEQRRDSVTCKSPNFEGQTLQQVAVAVSIDGGAYFSSPELWFTFLQVPFLESLSPASSIERVETSLIISGRDFLDTPTLACRFGVEGVVSVAQYLSGGRISCLTSKNSAPSTVEVEVTINGVDFTAQGKIHTFLPMVTTDEVVPSVGSVDGGMVINILGNGFIALESSASRLSCSWVMPGTESRDVLVTEA
ncbi:unnamed protein product, partial [Choristocarpus tenellus]